MTLYDATGRPVDLEALKREQAAPQFVGIRNIYSRVYPDVALTAEKLTAVLRQADLGDPWLYLELAEAMEEKDLHYLAVLSTRKKAVSMLAVTIEAASDSPQDQDDAAFVREVLLHGEIDLSSAIFDILDALGKGFSATEIIWDTEGNEWWPRALKWRDPRWFMFDWVSGEELLVRSMGGEGPLFPGAPNSPFAALSPRIAQTPGGARIGIQPATERLAPWKFIVHIARAKAGLPIRGGLARIAAWSYFFKNYVLKDWLSFAETYGQPLRVGKYGPGATEQDKAALLRAVANIGTDAAAVVPESMLIEFVQSRVTPSAELYEKFCDWLDRQVSKGILGQTLTTELPKGGGSRAAAEVHAAVRRDIAEDDARALAATLNRDLVQPIIELNRGPRARYPRITLGFPEEEDLELLSKALTPFIDRGLPVAQKALLDRFKLPAPEEGAALLHPVERIAKSEQAAASPPVAAPGPPGGTSLAPLWTDVDGESRRRDERAQMAAKPRRAQRDQPDKIDRFVERLRQESEAALAPMIRPLLRELRGARGYAELRDRLATAVRSMELGKFTDLLARAGFNARLAGAAALPITPRPHRRAKPRRKR